MSSPASTSCRKAAVAPGVNLVAACKPCNARKADRTPEEASMQLLLLPYVPSRFEDFLLEGRSNRADVYEWLATRLPKGSRLS